MLSFKSFLSEEIEKFTKLNHLSHLEDLPVESGEAGYHHAVEALKNVHNKLSGKFNPTKITTKFDGCLHENTLLYVGDLESGVMNLKSIREINEEWCLGKKLVVLGFDEETGENVKTLILDKLSLKDDKNWVELEIEGFKLILTSDHKIMTTNRGWIEAGNLVEGDDIKEY